jgi:hypothetical protein
MQNADFLSNEETIARLIHVSDLLLMIYYANDYARKEKNFVYQC